MVNSDWIDIELLEDYLDGKLDSKAMHQLEKQALDDPFVAQALAGLSESPRRASQSVSLLQKQLYERITQHQIVKKESVFTWQRLSVAAAAAVMFISVSLIFFLRDREARESLAKRQPKRVEVNMAPLPEVIDSAKETYAVNSRKIVSPADEGRISSRREAGPAPVSADKKEAVMQMAAVAADTNTAVAAAKAAVTPAVNARVASVMPAVSVPVGGWANFDTYVNDNNRFSKSVKTGKFVELSFMIDAEGSPSSIKITKGASPEFDEEAIRLISGGPKWEQPGSPGSRVIYTIAF